MVQDSPPFATSCLVLTSLLSSCTCHHTTTHATCRHFPFSCDKRSYICPTQVINANCNLPLLLSRLARLILKLNRVLLSEKPLTNDAGGFTPHERALRLPSPRHRRRAPARTWLVILWYKSLATPTIPVPYLRCVKILKIQNSS